MKPFSIRKRHTNVEKNPFRKKNGTIYFSSIFIEVPSRKRPCTYFTYVVCTVNALLHIFILLIFFLIQPVIHSVCLSMCLFNSPILATQYFLMAFSPLSWSLSPPPMLQLLFCFCCCSIALFDFIAYSIIYCSLYHTGRENLSAGVAILNKAGWLAGRLFPGGLAA